MTPCGGRFRILGAAALAFLGILLFRGADKQMPVWRPAGKADAPPGLRTAPQDPSPEFVWVAPEAPSQGTEAGRAARRAEAAAAAEPQVDPAGVEAPEEEVDEVKIKALHGDPPLTADHPHVASAIEVQERNTAWLMAHPAVVGTAVGLNDKGEVALMVLTRTAAGDLPNVVEGLPVVVWQTGEITARQEGAKTRDDVQARTHFGGIDGSARYARPVPIGVSTGHPNITAGTIGCRVKRDDLTVYALSNNHIYANENLALIGDSALQPGPYDGGQAPADAIGTLADFEPIVFTTTASNVIDAAIAVSSTDYLGNATPNGYYGTPKSAVVSPALKMKVKKVGRSSGQTYGTISGINATVYVGYDSGTARFVKQIVVKHGRGGPFSAGGDSGSLVVVDGGRNDRSPVGLLFAGSSSSTVSNPIGPVLSRFGVSVDGQ